MSGNRRTRPWWIAILLLCGSVAVQESSAQPTELLELESIVVGSSGPITFFFSDHGTGASSYEVRSAAALTEPIQWDPETEAVITGLDNGRYQVDVPEGSQDRFYSVTGANGNADSIEIEFPSTSLDVGEGGTGYLTVNFSRAYYGTIRYSIGGFTDPSDHPGLTGEVEVFGTTSVLIPISIADNQEIDELRQLVLTLQSGGGAVTGSNAQGVVTIFENDADWKGTISDAPASLGITLRIRELSGVRAATLVSNGAGLVPEGEYTCSLEFDDQTFGAATASIPLDPADTLQGLSATMVVSLHASDGQPGEIVSDNELRGTASVATYYVGNEHLNRTSEGTFALFKTPPPPSTRESTLTTAP